MCQVCSKLRQRIEYEIGAEQQSKRRLNTQVRNNISMKSAGEAKNLTSA